MIEDGSLPVETASLIHDQAFVVKFIIDGSDQFLILPFSSQREIVISQLYYLAIAKGNMKVLLDRLKQSYDIGLSTLKPEISSYMTMEKIKEVHLKKFLSLRSKIANHASGFRTLENHVELVMGFLDFNVKLVTSDLREIQISQGRPCTMFSERDNLQLFYLSPLKTITLRTGELISEASLFASTLSEIMTLKVNLKSQKYLERLQIGALVFAALSVILVFKTEISTAIDPLWQQFLNLLKTIKR